jgi:hypothetical protein
MSTQRQLSVVEQAELEALNDAVNTAIKTRRDWLDAKMVEISTLKPGDDIYDVDKGTKVGVVSKLYRYWAGRNDLLDDDPYCSYEYQVSAGWFNNTSSQVGVSFGTQQDALRRAELRADRLRGRI